MLAQACITIGRYQGVEEAVQALSASCYVKQHD
jgi:hypothetical protein